MHKVYFKRCPLMSEGQHAFFFLVSYRSLIQYFVAVSAGSRTRPRDEVSRSVASLVVTTSRRLRGELKKKKLQRRRYRKKKYPRSQITSTAATQNPSVAAVARHARTTRRTQTMQLRRV